MIGAFARMFGGRKEVCEVAEDEEAVYFAARAPGDPGEAEACQDAPPEGFVEAVDAEGGTVYFAPILESIRRALKGEEDGDA